MFSISVTGANNEEGRQELRKFDELLNRAFITTQKSSVQFTKIYYYKGKYPNANRTAINQAATSTAFAVPIQDATYAQQQTNLIHQANAFQGVNLIYSVNTD